MDNSSKNTKNHPNLESCGKIRENGLFSGEFADKKRKWKSKSCSEDLIITFELTNTNLFTMLTENDSNPVAHRDVDKKVEGAVDC